MSKDFGEVIELIRKEHPAFQPGAYYFVRQGLDYTLRKLKTGEHQRENNHVSGGELLDGMREFAIEQYGPMAKTLLDTWNITTCDDFGKIVFLLVDYGVLGKTENDSPEDFSGGFDFEDAFVKPFIPRFKLEAAEQQNTE